MLFESSRSRELLRRGAVVADVEEQFQVSESEVVEQVLTSIELTLTVPPSASPLRFVLEATDEMNCFEVYQELLESFAFLSTSVVVVPVTLMTGTSSSSRRSRRR